MTESVAIASSTDVGTSVDRCEILQKKFDDFANDVAANRIRADMLTEVAKALRAEGHPDISKLEARRNVGCNLCCNQSSF